MLKRARASSTVKARHRSTWVSMSSPGSISPSVAGTLPILEGPFKLLIKFEIICVFYFKVLSDDGGHAVACRVPSKVLGKCDEDDLAR